MIIKLNKKTYLLIYRYGRPVLYDYEKGDRIKKESLIKRVINKGARLGAIGC